jgi:hypothetical protein
MMEFKQLADAALLLIDYNEANRDIGFLNKSIAMDQERLTTAVAQRDKAVNKLEGMGIVMPGEKP